MELIKDTPLEVAWRVWQARPPRPSLTVVVKATYELVPEGECTLAQEQAFPSGDEHLDGDPERSLRYANDLEPLKPRGECFVVGSFHAPGGRPVAQSRVSIQIGPVRKQLAIFGERHWQLGRASEPSPTAEVPLTWENAFGGPGFEANPAGKGLGKSEVEGKQAILLPQIEDPTRPIGSRDARPAPMGCAPMPRTWRARMALAGTYDARWKAERYPWFPADLDWEHFNAAPRDQRIGGFFRGDEDIELLNLHKKYSKIACRLPGLMPRALLTPKIGDARELGLRLDTITVDTDQSLIFVVWRAVTEIDDHKLDTLESLYVAHDHIGSPRDEMELRGALASALLGKEEEEQAAEPEEPGQGLAPDAPGARWAHLDQAMTIRGDDAALQAALAQARAEKSGLLKPIFDDALGLGKPPSMDRQLTPEELLELEMQLALGGLLQKEEKDARAEVTQAIAARESLAGRDLTGADLSGLDLSGGDFKNAILTRVNLSGSHVEDACFDGASLAEAELSLAVFERCGFARADLTSARAERARFEECNFEDATISQCYLRETRWTRSALSRANLVESDLGSSTWRGCKLDEADLGKASLEQAIFGDCSLADAWLEGGVRAARAKFDGCEAPLLRASEGADFEGASFRKAVLDGARFSQAKLRGANFALAQLSRADFSEAFLMEAQMMGCDLRMARFDGASLVKASLLKSNLMQARFEGANLRFADLRGCNLFQAELFDAKLDDARLDMADLGGTRLGGTRTA